MCWKNLETVACGLYPGHYLSAPALSWDAMINMENVELELNPDNDLYLFFEKGTRDAYSYISKRYSKANNKYFQSHTRGLKYIWLCYV